MDSKAERPLRRTGALARSGEPADLADALEPLLASASLREELGRAGRERFLREFTDTAMQDRFYATLEAIVSGREPAARQRNAHGEAAG